MRSIGYLLNGGIVVVVAQRRVVYLHTPSSSLITDANLSLNLWRPTTLSAKRRDNFKTDRANELFASQAASSLPDDLVFVAS